ncbi:hypothetical protein THRCLA_09666 [Thraustotheca clavata]|uniref:DUF6818 domain-containing protein n=1 Tax=Thraustotheca clavata TaxID=74557 RepID=A0A1V9YVA5_9STRA|nr:hypothetical protein THRCLA_09666 [Thraustotheca clavata]
MTKVPPKPRTAIGVPNWAPTDVDILLSLVAETLPINQQQWQRLAILYNKHPDRRHERDWEAVKRKFNKLRSSAKLSTEPDCPEDVRLARDIQRDMELKAERQGHDTSGMDQSVEDEMALLENASRAHAFVHGEEDVDHGENDDIRADGEATSLPNSKPGLPNDYTQMGHEEQQQQIRPSPVREHGARPHLELLARRSRKRANEEVEPEPMPHNKRSTSLHDQRAIGMNISSELMSVLMLMDERAQIRQEQREEREEVRRRQQEAREDARWAALEERYMQERLQREEQRRKDDLRHERSERLQMLLLSKIFGVDFEKELQNHNL